jgi:hypothetical protein
MLVGEATGHGAQVESRLYSKDYKHLFRAKKTARAKAVKAAPEVKKEQVDV